MTYSRMLEIDDLVLGFPFGISDKGKELPSGNQFGPEYATPAANGGLRITRHNMNALGYLSTLATFLDRAGYQFGWRDMSAVGGYPKGAIVTRTNHGWFEQYINLEDNNTNEPVYEELLTDASVAEKGWKPLFSLNQFNFFPNYESMEQIAELTVLPSLPLNGTKVDLATPGWVLVKRTVDNWDDANNAYGDLSLSQRLSFSESNYVSLSAHAPNNTAPLDSSNDLFTMRYGEGQSATRFFPCNNGFKVTSKCANPVTGMTIKVYRFDMEES